MASASLDSASLGDTARALGHAVWLERRSFEIVGGWVRDTSDPQVRLVLAAQSRHHGWRAEQLAVLLPSTRDHDPVQLAAPLDAAAAAPVQDLAAAAVPDRVEAARRLLAAAIAHGEETLSGLRPVADAPALRLLRLALADAEDDLTALDDLS